MGKQLLVSMPPTFGTLCQNTQEWPKQLKPLNMHLRHTFLISLITHCKMYLTFMEHLFIYLFLSLFKCLYLPPPAAVSWFDDNCAEQSFMVPVRLVRHFLFIHLWQNLCLFISVLSLVQCIYLTVMRSEER